MVSPGSLDTLYNRLGSPLSGLTVRACFGLFTKSRKLPLGFLAVFMGNTPV
jgi:hypothetical protein